MAKANPKAWFPNAYVARMSHKSVGKWERSWAEHRPYFEQWAHAHNWMLVKASERVKKAQSELKSALAYQAKVAAMSEPVPAQGDLQEKP